MDNTMINKEKYRTVSSELLAKEILSQFKTEENVSHFFNISCPGVGINASRQIK